MRYGQGEGGCVWDVRYAGQICVVGVYTRVSGRAEIFIARLSLDSVPMRYQIGGLRTEQS
jgi:hypothetical protein